MCEFNQRFDNIYLCCMAIVINITSAYSAFIVIPKIKIYIRKMLIMDVFYLVDIYDG